MEEKRARILELVEQLNHAAAVYYQGRDEVMSNYEYDKQYDELQALEKETGIVLAGSPTQRVGYEVLSELPKEQHPSPMLSLDKTKDTEQLAAWLGGSTFVENGWAYYRTYVSGGNSAKGSYPR